AVEPHPDHRAIQDETDNILVSQRTMTPCLPIRLHLPPGAADNIFADRSLEQCPQRPPYPTRIGAGQIGAGDQRLHLPRHSRISWQNFAAPFSARPFSVVQPRARYLDRHCAKRTEQLACSPSMPIAGGPFTISANCGVAVTRQEISN